MILLGGSFVLGWGGLSKSQQGMPHCTQLTVPEGYTLKAGKYVGFFLNNKLMH